MSLNSKKYPKVSIIIPVYNGADYVGEAIDSALSQNYPNFEVVVINDGSKDNGATSKVCRSFGKKINYYEKENGGVASALNLGVKKMTGEYFSWLSHDDLYFKEKLSKEVELILKAPEKTILYSNFEEVDQTGSHLAFSKILEVPQKKFLASLIKDRFLHGCSLLIPKKAFEDVGLFDEALRNTQDYDLWFRFIEKGYQFKLCSDALVKSRKHNKQTSISTSDRQRIEDNKLYLKILDKFKPGQLVAEDSISLGLLNLAVSWQFLGFSEAAQKAYDLSADSIKSGEYIDWYLKSLEFIFLKIIALPLQFVMKTGARLKRTKIIRVGRESLSPKLLDSARRKICFIGNIDSSHNMKYAKFCVDSGYDVHFITFFPGKISGVKTYQILRRKFEPKLIWFLRTIFAVRKLVKKIQPTFIQGQYLSSGGVLAYLSGFRPYVVDVMGSDVLEPLPPVLEYLSKKTIGSAGWIIASTEILKKATVSFGGDKDKISVIPFGIDLDLFKPSKEVKSFRKTLNLNDEKIIFSPRFIDKIYNITTIVEAFILLKDKKVKLALADKPVNKEYYREVKELISRLKIGDKVIFLPPVGNERMPEYYNLSEVIVSIPNSEGQGVSVLEAMACEKKIIINNLPVFKEWERGNNFFKTKVSVKELSQVMEKSLKISQRDFAPIGKLNRKLVSEKANIENTFGELEEIYISLLNPKSE